VSFTAITICVASQRVFIVLYFVIDSVRKLLDTPSWTLAVRNCFAGGRAGNRVGQRTGYVLMS
jgi:hypothetical protein